MINEGKIGQSEAVALIVTATCTKVFLSYPAIMVAFGGSAGWMVVLLSGMLTLFFLGFTIKLLERFPDYNFPQIVEETAGSFFGGFIILAILAPWLFEAAMTFRRFGEMIIIVALPETPISIIMITFVSAAGLAANLGIQTLARSCYLAFPFSLGAVILIILLTIPNWNPDWLFPLLGKGIDEIIKSGLIRSGDFTELNLLYTIPLVYFSNQVKKIAYKSVLLSATIFLAVVLGYTLTFPAVVGEEPYLPLYMMARSVYLGRFLQRIEAIFVFFWVFSGYLWLSVVIYGFCRILKDYLNLPDYRPLILPTIAITLAVAFVPSSLPDAVLISHYTYKETGFVPVYGWPFLLLITAVIRKKGVTSNAKK